MDRRTAIALSMRRRGLPMDVIRDILREVYDAGRKARRALLKHIRGAWIVNYMLWDSTHGWENTRSLDLITAQTDHWLSLGRIGWTEREIRRVERRRTNREFAFGPYGSLWWEQWGVGSR